MLLCPSQLSSALTATVLRQWSLVRHSKGIVVRVVATVTKLRTALMQKSNRQLPTPLPTIVAKGILAEGSKTLVLTICRLQLVSCSLLLLH